MAIMFLLYSLYMYPANRVRRILWIWPRRAVCASVSSPIIFKFGMKVHYGKAKLPNDFGVGGDIVAMVTRLFVEIAVFVLRALYWLHFFSKHLQIWHEGPLWSGWRHGYHDNHIFLENLVKPVTSAFFQFVITVGTQKQY